MLQRLLITVATMLALVCCRDSKKAGRDDALVYPGNNWSIVDPEQLGLDGPKLDQFGELIGGCGCIVRHGRVVHAWGRWTAPHRMWSATKPVITTLLMLAVQEGKLAGVDSPVADHEPRLRSLNDGKDASITWSHFANQLSGYGLADKPGAAFAYNDYAIALYFDTLFDRVFKADPSTVLRDRIATPLEFDDECVFEGAEGDAREMRGILEISARDTARFGLLMLRNGKWKDRQLIRPDLMKLMLHSPVSASVPVSKAPNATMIPGQRTIGSESRNDTSIGPGFYTFNWWLNTDTAGHKLVPDAPADSIFALGISGRAVLWIMPELDMVISWNQSEASLPMDKVDDATSTVNAAAKVLAAGITNRSK